MSLPDGFVEEDGGGDGDIEGVETAEHRNLYVGICCLSPDRSQPCGLRTHHNSCGTAHVGVVIPLRILQLGGKDSDSILFEPCDGLF